MKNANPKMHRRLEDKIAAQKAGKSLRIVVPGNCRVCKRRSADVPATKTQVLAWFTEKSLDGFLKYEQIMLTEGTHRDCQRVEKGLKPLPVKPNTVQQCIDIAKRADKARKAAKAAAKVA